MRRISRKSPALAAALALSLALPAAAAPDATLAPAIVQPQVTGLKLVVIRRWTGADWKRTAVLVEPWFYCSLVVGDRTSRPAGHGQLFAVPGGYVTDFASVPGWSRAWTPPFGAWAEASVIHDWLYDIGAPGRRKDADAIFKEALEDMRVSDYRRWFMHLAVRVGGLGPYKKAAERDETYWKSHFVNALGEPAPPPFDQPIEMKPFKASYPCGELEKRKAVEALKAEYLAKHPGAILR